jgi:3-(3-hydroxy-phenyl)propionate hydroxylase
MSADPVVVVGAGPGGAAAALALAQREIPVLLVEAEPALGKDLRAGTFHPPTVEILAALGLGEKALAMGIKVPVWQIRDRRAGVVAEFDLGLLADVTPFPFRLHCEQHKMTALALEAIGKHSHAQVRFATRFVGATADAGGVTVRLEGPDGPEQCRASFLIGADGARSAVRKAAGIDFPGYTWPERFLVVSTFHDFANDGFSMNAYIADPEEWVAIFKMPHEGPPGLWRLAFPIKPETPDEEALSERFCQRLVQGFLHRAEPYAFAYRSIYRVHQRVAETFDRGRVLLLGDAAHVNNPLGGMGLNSAVQDAANLAEKLGRIWHEGAPLELLGRYTRQRRTTNIEFVQAQSIRNKQLLEERDPLVRRRNLDELRAIAADPMRARAHLMRSSMIESMRRAASIE